MFQNKKTTSELTTRRQNEYPIHKSNLVNAGHNWEQQLLYYRYRQLRNHGLEQLNHVPRKYG